MKTALQAPWLVRDIHSMKTCRMRRKYILSLLHAKKFKLVKVLGHRNNKKNGIHFLLRISNIIRPVSKNHGRYSASVALKQ
jgi:hypothetical protein